jgi:hypothetical protein
MMAVLLLTMIKYVHILKIHILNNTTNYTWWWINIKKLGKNTSHENKMTRPKDLSALNSTIEYRKAIK